MEPILIGIIIGVAALAALMFWPRKKWRPTPDPMPRAHAQRRDNVSEP